MASQGRRSRIRTRENLSMRKILKSETLESQWRYNLLFRHQFIIQVILVIRAYYDVPAATVIL
eukprot:1380526-Amorphochlora_amoeboformis.AAC.1